MSRQFTVILKNDDLSVADIHMAIENYADELFDDGELSEILEFEKFIRLGGVV